MVPPEQDNLRPDADRIQFQKRCFQVIGKPRINYADLDELVFHPKYGLFIHEYTKVSKNAQNNKGLSPADSDPNRYWNSSYDGEMYGNKGKFISQYQIARAIGARYIIICYGEEGGKYDNIVKTNEVDCVFHDGIVYRDGTKHVYSIEDYAKLYFNFMSGLTNNEEKLKKLYESYSLEELGKAKIYGSDNKQHSILSLYNENPEWVRNYPQTAASNSEFKSFNVPVVEEFLKKLKG